MNFALVTILALSAQPQFETGLVLANHFSAVASYNEVTLIESEQNVVYQKDAVLKTPQDVGDNIIILNDDYCSNGFDDDRFCDYGAYFYPNTLNGEVPIKMSVIEADAYYEGTEALGYRTEVEMPLDSLNFGIDQYMLRIATPTFSRQPYEDTLGTSKAEVIYKVDDNIVFAEVTSYRLGSAVRLHVVDFVTAFTAKDYNSKGGETLTVSVMPVDVLGKGSAE